MVDRLGHRRSAEDSCPRWVDRGPDQHHRYWAALCMPHSSRWRVAVFTARVLKTRSLGSQEPELVGLQPEGSLPSDSTDCPAKGPTSLPPAELPRFGGRCATPMTVTARSSGHLDTNPTAYLRRCDRLSIGAAAARCRHWTTRHTDSPHVLNRPPERPTAEHATPVDFLHSRPSGASMTTPWFITGTSSGTAR